MVLRSHLNELRLVRGGATVSAVAGALLGLACLPPAVAVAAPGPSRIIFERSWNNSEFSQLVSMLPDGTDQTVLLSAKGDGLASPRYSPDGSRIAYARFLRNGSYEIFVMKADGRRQRQLTHAVEDSELARSPSWSPDARRIVYSSNRGTGTTQGHIFTVGVGGGRSRELTFGPGDDESPSYSPDGRQIVFSRDRGGYENICVISSDGGRVRCIARIPNSTIDTSGEPSFSPDGSQIVFDGIEADSICLMNADGSDLRELAKGHGADPSSTGEIVFVGGEGSSYGIYTMRSDGSGQAAIAGGEGKYEFNGPSW